MGENDKRDNVANYGDVKKERRINFILKVVSVFCALVLWFYVAGTDNENYKKEISSVPVSIFTSKELSVIQGVGATTNVTVSGKKDVINNITSENITAYVDLSDISTAGRYTRTIDVTVSGIEGVSIVSKTPDNLSVYLDKTTSVSVPVEARVYGYMLNDGYEIGEIKTGITEVNVSGPEAELLGISRALAVVEFEGDYLTRSTNVSAELKLVDSDGNVISGSYVSMHGEKYVDVSIPVYLTKTVPLSVEYKYGFFNEENTNVILEPSSVSIRGKAEAVESINSINIATIDEKKVKNNTSISEELVLPLGVSCTDGTETVKIRVEYKGVATKPVLASNYNLINPKAYDCEIVTDYVAVLLCGPDAMLDSINASDIIINVDLSSVANPSDTKPIPVTVTLPESVSYAVYELGSYSVNVQFN